jgi:hypothetical protein
MSDDVIADAHRSLARALAARDQSDLSWLQPPPSADGWTLAPDALRLLDALVGELRPRHVIEFGAGTSTAVITRACTIVGSTCAITSIDHDPEFGVPDSRGVSVIASHVTLSSVQAPLVARDCGAKLLPTYFLRADQRASAEAADLVLIDGPPVSLGGREGVLYQVLPWCRPGTIVLLDDAARGSERSAVHHWQTTLGGAIDVRRLEGFVKGLVAVIVRDTRPADDLWAWRVARVRQQIAGLTPPDASFVLVDAGAIGALPGGRRGLALVQRDGEDWGLPEDEGAAASALEARRAEGAIHFVLPWTSFWWADEYPAFMASLRRFRCVADNDLLLAFDVRTSGQA